MVEASTLLADELRGQLCRHGHRQSDFCLPLEHEPAPLGVGHPPLDVRPLLPALELLPCGQDKQLEQVVEIS